MRRCVIPIVILLAALLASCGQGSQGLTKEFRSFLKIRKSQPETARAEELDGFTCSLESGVLQVYDPSGASLWQSADDWYVEDFRLGDVDGDGAADLLFSLWKSYSFGSYHPERMENDDPAVRCHLFLYTLRAGRMKQLWCSSSLPRPIYAFALSLDGEKTPVSSGAVLRTTEGQYTEGFSHTQTREYVYIWRGWGFVEE